MTLQQPASAEKSLRKIDIAQVRLTQGHSGKGVSKLNEEKIMNAMRGGPAWVAWQAKRPQTPGIARVSGLN